MKIDIREKRFGGEVVLGRIELEIEPGERVAIMGPSGIGKSTLLRIANGSDRDFDGAVEVAPKRAAIFQEPTLLPWMDTRANIALFCPALSMGEIDALLDRVGLSGKGRHFPGQLSLGQQRRLALLRGFGRRPDFLTMDEPFASLDAPLAREMIALCSELLDDFCPALLLATHSLDEAKTLCKCVYELSGSPASLRGI